MPSDEQKTAGLVSTVMMSLYRVTDQYGPNWLSGVKCTGSSRRSLANQSGHTSSWKIRASATSIRSSGVVQGSPNGLAGAFIEASVVDVSLYAKCGFRAAIEVCRMKHFLPYGSLRNHPMDRCRGWRHVLPAHTEPDLMMLPDSTLEDAETLLAACRSKRSCWLPPRVAPAG